MNSSQSAYELFDQTYQWQKNTFTLRDPILSFGRAMDEVVEALDAFGLDQLAEWTNDVSKAVKGRRLAEGTDPAKVGGELADIVIVLNSVAGQLGLNLGDLVAEKMNVNISRTWNLSEDGTGQHVEN
jgi:NTP pyrophosphatase (non-canonical NTP hydrolase)